MKHIFFDKSGWGEFLIFSNNSKLWESRSADTLVRTSTSSISNFCFHHAVLKLLTKDVKRQKPYYVREIEPRYETDEEVESISSEDSSSASDLIDFNDILN